jgi:signal transduction histidine kinase
MFKQINLQTRLFLAFLAPSSIALLAVFHGIFIANQLSSYSNQLSENNLPSVDGLWKINEGQTQIDAAENLLLSQTLSSSDRTLALTAIQQAWEQVNAGFEQAFSTPPNNEQERQLEAQFRQNWEAWKRAHKIFLDREQQFHEYGISAPEQKSLELLLQGQSNSLEMQRVNAAIAARSRLLEATQQKQPLFTQATKSVLALLQNNQEFAAEIQRASILTTHRAQVIAIVVLLSVPPIVGILAWMLSQRIAQPIDQEIGDLIKDLELARDTLEEKVEERTQALQEALHHLTKTQLQLVQAEKMSSLGQLVAGVAHEINNPVNFIHGNLGHVREYADTLMAMVQLYQRHYPSPSKEIQAETENLDLEFVQEDLPKILSSMKLGTDRIRQIVLSLRNFSRIDEAEFKTVDIREGIDSTLLILQHRFKEKPEHPQIEVIKEYGNLPLIECYPGQFNQVVMNILANAIDALEQFNTMRTLEEIKKHPNQITIRTSAIDAKWVQISIADNGPGMTAEVKQQIFNPFFTTKPIGKGTGMGMSISYQIITENHAGNLTCTSTVGQGTEFVIQLPVQQQDRKAA